VKTKKCGLTVPEQKELLSYMEDKEQFSDWFNRHLLAVVGILFLVVILEETIDALREKIRAI
jgi:hypothetical protein